MCVKNLLFFSITLLLSACYDNQICLDIDKQTIRTCNGKNIGYLTITNTENHEFLYFTKKKGMVGVNKFNLDSLSNDYQLFSISNEILIDNFRLEPQKEYEISNNTYGDAAGSTIIVKTNQLGKIEYVDKCWCD
jgi:hypothetical protein